MTSRLQPTNDVHQEAILVGDPGRALMLAQELLDQPKMSNHARGLWGYSGERREGRPGTLTIQSTGMGGPSAAIVLADLARLGVRRAIRVGTADGLDPEQEPGSLLKVGEVIGLDGTSRALTGSAGSCRLKASPGLLATIEAGPERVTASSDLPPGGPGLHAGPLATEEAVAVDLQTAALYALGPAVGVEVAAVLVVERDQAGAVIEPDLLTERVQQAAGSADRALAAAATLT